MRMKNLFLLTVFFVSTTFINAQNRQPVNFPGDNYAESSNAIEVIAGELVKISKSVEELNKKFKAFGDTFSSNQGLRLTDRQQKLLIAFEFLNRSEQRMASLQTLKLTLSERQTTIRLQLAKITDDLLPESIDRYVSMRGTTNAEQLRDIRRQSLTREKNELTTLVYEIQRDLNDINEEIAQTDMFLKNLRKKLFPEVEKEISDL